MGSSIRVNLGEVTIQCLKETMYVGVVIRNGMKFAGHYKHVMKKNRKTYGKMKGLANVKNGTQYENLRLYTETNGVE